MTEKEKIIAVVNNMPSSFKKIDIVCSLVASFVVNTDKANEIKQLMDAVTNNLVCAISADSNRKRCIHERSLYISKYLKGEMYDKEKETEELKEQHQKIHQGHAEFIFENSKLKKDLI